MRREMVHRNATPNLLLLVGLPLILIFLAIIVLLVLVFVCYISVKLWQRLRGTDADSNINRGSSILSSVKLTTPPPPKLAYHMAAPLGDPTESARYPYYTVPHESKWHRPGLMEEQNTGASSQSPSPFIRLGYETKRRINSSENGETSQPEVFISLFHNTHGDENAPLVIWIDKAINLPLREDMSKVDSYVRLFFICKIPGLPHRRTWRTKVVKESSDPVFDEEVRYEEMCADELINSTLHIEVLDYQPHGKHSILGQVDLHLAEIQFTSEEIFAVLTLQTHPPHDWESHGTVLLSVNYNPNKKKLSVIILRAKDLKGNAKGLYTQTTIWVTLNHHVIGKLKTSRKTGNSPIFNEVLTCHLEPKQSHNVTIKVILFDVSPLVGKKELGQVTLCAQSSGDEYRHWNEAIATPGKHIAEWHELRW